jgi:hypothetical protein
MTNENAFLLYLQAYPETKYKIIFRGMAVALLITERKELL